MSHLKNTRKSLLALGLLALLASGLIAALLYGQRNASQNGMDPAPNPEAGKAALEASNDDAEPEPSAEARQIWVLEFGGRGEGGARVKAPSEDSLSAPDQGPATLRELPRGNAQIAFVVQDASGRPQPDVRLQLTSLKPVGGAERIVTGAGGEARFLDLAPGPYAYRAQAPDGPERASDSLRLEPGERKHLTVRLTGTSLSISGRVQNQRGEPVVGIEVSAIRHRFASAVSESVSGDGSPRTTRSQGDGSFEIRGLAEGEYDVETRAIRRFARAKVLARAGGAPVDLVLREGFRVYGIVTNASGEALARVHVGAQGRTKAGAYTNPQGGYELQLERDSDPGEAAYALQFKLQGYELQERPLPQLGLDASLDLRVDVELHAVEDAALVTGVVETERGEPVAGATVSLSRRSGPNNHAVSGADGNFSLPNVEVGPGYHLSVLGPVSFRDYAKQGIRVMEDGLSLEIVLKSLATGRLTGRMVDVQGNPLPGMRLWLGGASARSAVPVSGDQRGFFKLEEAPAAGSLSFDTRSSPRLYVSGLTLRADGEADVLLVLDWGEEELSGEVLDDRGDPVAGAQVSLSWSHASGGLQSTSQRATTTNPSGSFRFSQLGPDEHRLEVRAPGYRTVQERHAVGRNAAEVEVRLEPDG
jgi:hypothetical protein